jgi:hypothetical protein
MVLECPPCRQWARTDHAGLDAGTADLPGGWTASASTVTPGGTWPPG